MVTKRVSPGKKTTRRKTAATVAPKPTDSAANVVLDSAQPMTAVSTSISPDVRRQLVAAEAYFLAERRGFAAGYELEDWAAAEAVVDARLQQTHAA